MKNILFYTDTPQTGGAELQIFLLAKFLNKKNFTPILAVSNYQNLDKWCENFEKEGIKVIRINVKHKHDPQHYFQLKQIIKTERINILHAHVWNPASCRYAFAAASSAKIPIVTTEHDPFKLSWLKDLFKKSTLKKTAKIITVSENNKAVLDKLYPQHSQKIAVIKNGIDITWWQSQILRFTPDNLKKIKKDVFGAKEDTLILISIAELHERKGLKYLIKAIPPLAEKYPNIKLVIIGEGPDRSNLENLIQDLKIENHVSLLGRQQKIPQLLKSSNIFVLPSRREAFGLVNLEAMLTPLPIVATRAGGIPEVVADDKTGILVEPEDTEALKLALEKLIKDSGKREKMAQAGLKRVEKYFSAEHMAQEYEKIYLTVSTHSPIIAA